MQTYNGIKVPTTVNPKYIISAFQNEMDYNKVEEYARIMSIKMLSHEFPPIQGYPCKIDEDDIMHNSFIDGRKIQPYDLGKTCWRVTDGHHRSLAANIADLPHIETTLDYSCITSEEDFKNFDN